MTSPTSRIPTWATDATVPTGYTDEGLATREEPSEAEKARGYIGDRPPSASFDNWLVGGICDWLKHLAPLRMRSWRRDAGCILTPLGVLCSANPTSAAYSGTWLLPTYDGTTTRLVTWPGTIVNNGQFGGAGYLSFGTVKLTNSVRAGDFCYSGNYQIGGGTHTIVWKTDLTTASVTEIRVVVGTYVSTMVAAEGGVIVAVPAGYAGWVNGAKFWISSDFGSTWSEYTISNSAVGRTVRCVEIKDGNIVVAFATSNVVSFVNRTTGDQFYQSTVGSAGAAGLAYFNGAWHVLIQGSGILARHYGSYWSAIATIANAPPVDVTNNDAYGNFVGNCLASDGGSCIAVATETDYVGAGVATSSDGGATWSYDTLLGAFTLTHKPTFVCLSYGDGAFIAVISGPNAADDAKTYTSIFRTLTL